MSDERKAELFRLVAMAGLLLLMLAQMVRAWQTRTELHRLVEQVEDIKRMQYKALSTAYLTNSTSIFAFGYEALAGETNVGEVYYFGERSHERRTNAVGTNR